MPQAAQQDYLVIKGAEVTDYRLIAKVASLIERKTLFDAVIAIEATGEHPFIAECRPLSIYGGPEGNTQVDIYYDEGYSSIAVPPFTQTQFEGLIAIQNAHGADYANEVILATYGYPEDDEPFIYLADSEADAFICVDDKLLVCTTDGDGQIISLEVSDITEEGELGHINISWEDAQKLIGLPIS